MPTYEYQCDSCKKHFEYFQSINDPRKTVCEACGGKLERVISGAGFVLKGGGWYKDGYGSAKGSGSDGGGAVAAPAADAGTKPAAETKTETKTETKSESSAPGKADK